MPLADRDPVPGDPVEVESTAARHADLAAELRDQAASLRTLASSEGWDADAGRVFAASAKDLARQLDTVRRRYATIADALNAYAPQLRQAQSEADAALTQAKAAKATSDANQAPVSLPPEAPAYAREYAEAGRRNTLADAAEDLRRARQRLANAVQLRDVQAGKAASRIRAAIADDGLKDSTWDRFSNWVSHGWDRFMAWVHEHAKTIDAIAELAGLLATVIGIVAMVISFIPVLNFLTPVLLGIAAGLTAIALVCHLMLALSGDGSWVDVGFDIFALVTFGFGTKAAAGLKAAKGALQKVGRKAVSDLARKEVRQATRAAIKEASALLKSRVTKKSVRLAMEKTVLPGLKDQARRAGMAAGKDVLAGAENATLPMLSKLSHLDGTVAGTKAFAQELMRAGGNSAKVTELGNEIVRLTNRMRVTAGAATGLNLIDEKSTVPIPFTDITVDLTGPLPDKGTPFDRFRPALRFGRYSGG